MKLTKVMKISVLLVILYIINSYYNLKNTARHLEVETIKTRGCIIPGMRPFDERIIEVFGLQKYMRYKIKCHNKKPPLIQRNRTHIWVVQENKAYYKATNLKCCLQRFYRPAAVENVWAHNVDDRVRYTKCYKFTDVAKVRHEFVKAKCYQNGKEIYKNLFLFAPKLKFHKNVDGTGRHPSNYNIVILGVDNVSRMHFHRSMPKTLKFLKEKGAVELRGYTKVGWNSYPNIVAMLTGFNVSELSENCYPHRHAMFDFCPFMWTRFKKVGYYTAFGEDSALAGTFNYLAHGFMRRPTDYYMRTFVSEANKSAKAKICLNETPFYEVMLRYVEDILWSVRKSTLFGFFWEISMSHLNFHGPALMDDGYLNFFKRLDRSIIDRTIFFIVSDHGSRMGDVRNTAQGRLEERLPAAFILTPRSFQRDYEAAFNNLKQNAARLTTPYDIHRTLVDLLDFWNIKTERILSRTDESNKRGVSLFLPISTDRTCDLAGIEEEWCACTRKGQSRRERVRRKEGQEAAAMLVAQLNSKLKGHTRCAKLQLSRLVDATQVALDPHLTHIQRDFLVVVSTEPGNGMFEGIVRFDSKHRQRQLTGMLRRINLYGNQSYCVEDRDLKPYCYCLPGLSNTHLYSRFKRLN